MGSKGGVRCSLGSGWSVVWVFAHLFLAKFTTICRVYKKNCHKICHKMTKFAAKHYYQHIFKVLTFLSWWFFILLKYYLSSWFFVAAMANLRPQNLPLSAIYSKFYYFSWKILVFTILKPKWFFLKWQSSESQHHPFLLLSHNSFKAPSLFKTVILKPV